MIKLLISCLGLLFVAACGPLEALPLPSEVPTLASPTSTSPVVEKGPVFISSSEMQISRTSPARATLHITGDLPTPCHRFEAEVAQPDAHRIIQVSVYSVVTTQAMCTQVLQPFDQSVLIDMKNRFDGTYTIYLNGEPAGQLVIKGGQIKAVSQ